MIVVSAFPTLLLLLRVHLIAVVAGLLLAALAVAAALLCCCNCPSAFWAHGVVTGASGFSWSTSGVRRAWTARCSYTAWVYDTK